MVGPSLSEKDGLSSSWPPIVGRSAASASRSPKMAPFSSPDAQWRQPYDSTSEYETLSLKINPPRVVVDNTTDINSTLVKVDSANRHGCLLEVVQVLTDLDLVISKAYISSDGGWFVDVFHVKDQLGNKVIDEGLIEYIQSALGAKREVSVREVRTCLGRPVAVQALAGHTAIELTGTDRPGLLSEVSAVITHFGCNVAGAEVWTHNMRVACVVYVTDRVTGGPIQDPLLMANLKEQLGQVMKADGGRSTSKTDFSIGLTHTERRLHQMMFADRDYETSSFRNQRLTSHDNLSVSVRNCGETMYSIVSVKCKDRPKLLFDTVCTLTDMHYTVFHATIDSSEEIATQEYYIRNMEGCTLDSEAERERVIKCLEAAIERRTPEGIRLELRTSDRLGLLSDVTRVFRENGLSVTKADVATQGEQAVNIFYVTDAAGNPVDMKVVEAMRREIGHTVLQVKEAGTDVTVEQSKPVDKSGPSFVHMLRSHSERWLINLGLGLGASPPSASSPSHGPGLAASTRW